MKVEALAEALGCPFDGAGGRELDGVAELATGGPTDLGFVRSEAHGPAARASRLGAVVAPPGLDVGPRAAIRSPNPGLHFARAVSLVAPRAPALPGVHASAVVDPSAGIDPTATIGARTVVGAGCHVGAGSVLHANVTLYDDVQVGRACVVHAGVVLREGTRVGDRVVLQAGASIGGDGFGFALSEAGRWEHVPHRGRVVLEDDVEIGANSAVDRAMFGETRIARGAKIDDLVMVAHNCSIGEDALLAGQVGLAGSTTIGRRALLMGQSGASGHLTIGDGAFIGAKAGIHKDVAPGDRIWGAPQQSERSFARSAALFAKLPDLARRLRALEKKLNLR